MSIQKKILLLTCSVLLNTAIYAQEWAPVGATWHYSEGYFDSLPLLEGFIKLQVEKDTVFMGVTCKKITKYHKILCNDRPDIEYMFERNDSVFFWDPNFNEFQLLYDFGATQNDSWRFKVLHDSRNEVDTFRVHVDSVGTININGFELKKMHVNYTRISKPGEDESYTYQSTIIEPIGDSHYMFNYIPFWAEVCDANMSEGLRCYSDGVIGTYETGIADSCEAVLVWKDDKINAPEPEEIPDVILNASERLLTLKNLNNTKTHYNIFNLSGKVVQAGGTESSVIDIRHLHHGLYLIILYNTDNLVVVKKKFVITDR